MEKRNYWKTLTEDILKNKLLVFWVVFTATLCFGFTITNFSIGVDDSARDYYFYSSSYGNMIQQGRLLHVALNLLTRSVEFIPFFTDFVGAVLFAFSALLYCAFFQFLSNRKLSLTALVSFACVYISNSIIAEKYIYHLDVIATMLSYCCSAVALMYAYRFVREKQFSLAVKAVVVLMGAIASYESFVFLYFCGVFAIFILDIVINKEDKSFRAFLQEGIKYAVILCAALILYYGLVYLIQYATGQSGVYTRYSIWETSDLGFFGTLSLVFQDMIVFFADSLACRYIPVVAFCLFSVIGLVLSSYLSYRRKNIWLLVCFAALWVGNFFIHLFGGGFMARAAQTFCFFIGFIVLLLIETCGTRALFRRALSAAVILLVFIQSADMNRWFYNDYVRYQKETFVVDTVATKLAAEYDLSKPVVFTNYPEDGYLNTSLYPGNQVNGNSMLYWTTNAWSDKTQPFVSEIFRMHGYDFITSPTPEQYDQAYVESETMPAWPKEGCIQEFEEFIVVNFD